jgi:outer membrane protein assembly factor BamB
MKNRYWNTSSIFFLLFLFSCGVLRIRDFPEQIKADKDPLLTANLTYSRNSLSPEELSPPLAEEWSEEFMSLPYNGFTAVDNWLLFGTYNGYLVIADINDGDMKGKRNLGDACANPPTVKDQLIFQSFETGSYGLISYDIYHGRVEWRLEGQLSRSAPVVIDNRVFHTTLQGEVICLNIESGEEIWRVALQSDIRNSPAFQGDKLIIATLSGKIFSLEYSSGVVVWKTEIPTPIFADPVIDGESAYIVGQKQDLYIFNTGTGEQIHRQKIKVPIYHSPTIDDTNIFLPLSDGRLVCLDKKTYIEKWVYKGDGPAAGPALVSDSYIYLTSLAEKLTILDKSNGKILQEITLSGRARSAPIIKKGKLILSCEDKQVIAYAKED